MNRHINTFIILIASWVFSLTGNAQEQLRPLSGNIQLQHIKRDVPANNSIKKVQTVTPLDLPFFEDFSYAYKNPYPKSKYWKDSSVYVNTGFPIAPPSLGVATFDGLNKYGYPYNPSASSTVSGSADTLTSQPINLQLTTTHSYTLFDSLRFSFFYQARGQGDPPESGDSLCLDFFKPNQKTWVNVWGRKGYNPSGSDTLFHFVMIAINDTAYLDSLFTFRFRNKGSQTGSLDHWNLDYVYLNKNRNMSDTIFDDIAFGMMPSSYLKNYSAMPSKQFQPTEMATNVHNWIRNNNSTFKNVNYWDTIYTKNDVMLIASNITASDNCYPFPSAGWLQSSGLAYPSIGYTFPVGPDTTFYKIRHIVHNATDIERRNDTITQIQRLSNYYAYDDCSAEVGYYLNAYGARFAQRFTLNVQDTLQALDIYFDPVLNVPTIGNLALTTAFMCVWTDSGNGPSTNRLLKDSIGTPVYLKESYYNVMPRFALSSPLVMSPGTYYIGLQQVTNTGLNIGFDKNTDHHDVLYYDIGNGWTQSAIKGSVMVHPVFGRHDYATGIEEKKPITTRKAFDLYPNPAQNEIYISCSHQHVSYTEVEVVSSLGQNILKQPYHGSSEAIDVSGLESGIYFIYLTSSDSKSAPEKLIISR
ncbi:MAG: T9SS type A sorting domain-containing protein [Bacteroidetes bacterium]|nr:T9SS type A sorting domain-containing protein [Bacteroidota bacterium]